MSWFPHPGGMRTVTVLSLSDSMLPPRCFVGLGLCGLSQHATVPRHSLGLFGYGLKMVLRS